MVYLFQLMVRNTKTLHTCSYRSRKMKIIVVYVAVFSPLGATSVTDVVHKGQEDDEGLAVAAGV